MSALRAAVLYVLCGCAQLGFAATETSSGTDETALSRLHEEVVRLIGDATCANLVHCRVLAIGNRPCGGPSEYLAYSSIAGNRELIEAKAFEYSFLEEEVNGKRNRTGICQMLAEPRVTCVDRRCRLVPANQ